jgi:hypothetical protein
MCPPPHTQNVRQEIESSFSTEAEKKKQVSPPWCYDIYCWRVLPGEGLSVVYDVLEVLGLSSPGVSNKSKLGKPQIPPDIARGSLGINTGWPAKFDFQRNTSMQYLEHSYANKLSAAYLKFRLDWALCITIC